MKIKIAAAAAVLCMLFAPAASAKTDISIGEYVQMGEYYGEPILWRCVDQDENGTLMLSDKILCIKAYDAAGENNYGSHGRGFESGANRRLYGSNYWGDSNIREWLNSAAYSVKWSCENPPSKNNMESGYNAYDNEPGFLTNFSPAELGMMKLAIQNSILDEYERSNEPTPDYHIYNGDIADVIQNYESAYMERVTDKVFLLDIAQANAVYKNLGSYYVAKPTQKCVENSEYKTSLLGVGNSWCYWLRTPACGDAGGHVRCVHSDGSVDYHDAYYDGMGIRPAFYLDTDASFIGSGSGSEQDPYILSDTETKTKIPPAVFYIVIIGGLGITAITLSCTILLSFKKRKK